MKIDERYSRIVLKKKGYYEYYKNFIYNPKKSQSYQVPQLISIRYKDINFYQYHIINKNILKINNN